MKGYKLPKGFCVRRSSFRFEKVTTSEPFYTYAFSVTYVQSEKEFELQFSDEPASESRRFRGVNYEIPREYREKVLNYKGPFIISFDYDFEIEPTLPRLERFLKLDRKDCLGVVNDIKEIENSINLSVWDFIDAQESLKSLYDKYKSGEQFSDKELDVLTQKLHQKDKESDIILKFINSHFYDLFEKLRNDGLVKICRGCGRVFQRSSRLKNYHWSKKDFCSSKCRERTAKRESYKRQKEKKITKRRIQKAITKRKETESVKAFRQGTF